MNCLINGSLDMTISNTECGEDFDYDVCKSIKCSYLPVCWNYYQMAKSNGFKSLIGNYELFD